MNIGLIGYGKMGQSIERQAILRGHKKLFITNKTPSYKELKNSNIEIIIEFSSHKFAVSNIIIKEIHHKNKLDTPSGTAIALAKDIILENYCDNWGLVYLKENKRYIYIYSKRIKNIIGIHSVLYESDIDSIEIKHIANNRTGFALGSVIAAEWLYKKFGFFSMKDVIKFN